MSGGPLGALLGTRIRRVDRPSEDLVSLVLGRAGFKTVLLLSTSPPGLGCVQTRPVGWAAEGMGKRLRNDLEGAVIRGALRIGSALAIDLSRGGDAIGLIVELGSHPNLVVLDHDSVVRVALHRGPVVGEPWSGPDDESVEIAIPAAMEDLLSAGARLLDVRGAIELETRIRLWDRALRAAQKRVSKRAEATLGDLERAEEAAPIRSRAAALIAIASTLPRHATSARITDWSTEPPSEIAVSIDPALGAAATAEKMFKRARKLEVGATIAATRHDAAVVLGAAIQTLRERLTRAASDAELERIEADARALPEPIRMPRSNAGAPVAETRRAYRLYEGSGARDILVGRSSSDNDELTFRIGKPHDLWLHVRGSAGSHVIVPLRKGEVCPVELLVDAAHLAVHFSSLRGEPVVEVQYVKRGYVRKPRGAPPGAVSVSQERVLALRVESERLARLLAPRSGHEAD